MFGSHFGFGNYFLLLNTLLLGHSSRFRRVPCEFGKHCEIDRIKHDLAFYFFEGKYCGSEKMIQLGNAGSFANFIGSKPNNLICTSADKYFNASVCALIQAFSVFSKVVQEQTRAITMYYNVFYAKTSRDGLVYSTGTPIFKNITTQKHSVY